MGTAFHFRVQSLNPVGRAKANNPTNKITFRTTLMLRMKGRSPEHPLPVSDELLLSTGTRSEEMIRVKIVNLIKLLSVVFRELRDSSIRQLGIVHEMGH